MIVPYLCYDLIDMIGSFRLCRQVLESKEIIQINTTIIAGVLIFMTLGLTSFSDKESSVYRFIITVVTSSVLVPFALSATAGLDSAHTKAIKLLKAGLLYTVIISVVFVILSFLSDIAGMMS